MSTPRIAVIGDGRMGRTIARLARDRGWAVTAVLGADENEGGKGITREALGDAEVMIEFTTPNAAGANVRAGLAAGYAVLSGTTGWDYDLSEVRKEVRAGGGAFLHAANFSLGVNIFMEILRRAGRVFANSPGFDAHLLEMHHTAKVDAPSGTALAMVRAVAEGLGRDIPVTSMRVGHVPGTHEVLFDGVFEQITLTHAARDRMVFADGALVAAEWLREKTGVFSMADVLGLESDEGEES
jgi:4-hydroxy-tetrahydrodipicolinate reductase